jgi:hypothetical protein
MFMAGCIYKMVCAGFQKKLKLSRVVEITAAHILSEKYSRKIASMLWQ